MLQLLGSSEGSAILKTWRRSGRYWELGKVLQFISLLIVLNFSGLSESSASLENKQKCCNSYDVTKAMHVLESTRADAAIPKQCEVAAKFLRLKVPQLKKLSTGAGIFRNKLKCSNS